jgi:hypothetical protein
LRTSTITHLGDLALLALVLATDDQNLVVFSDGDRSDLQTDSNTLDINLHIQTFACILTSTHVVLGSQFLVQGRAHDLSLLAGGGSEVGLSGLSSVVSND